jgi:hypothetical protein
LNETEADIMGQGLTVGESRVLKQVVAGHDLEAIAQELNVAQDDAWAQITRAVRKVAERIDDHQPDAVAAAKPRTSDDRRGNHVREHDRRREARIQVYEACRAVSYDGTVFDNAVLTDLSPGGARLRLSQLPRAEQMIVLQQANGHARTSQVVWVGDDEIGVRFTDDRPSDVVDDAGALRQKAQSIPVARQARRHP